ncbi:HD domain-containing protein [Clostridium ihumii]|uniref:HD domain-containing protein n=1 Tax=Clostridium ihumii TaxID=1470356 RepID=UPI00058C2F0E|nr:HD domain-containing protein [Clostridium ihumii]
MYTLGVEVPTIREAQKLLEEGYKLFPGQWIRHLTNTGKAAELIAKQCGDLDPEVALVLGMLHDIGYRYGNTGIKHSLLGYNFAMDRGYTKLAQICLTHSFDCKDIKKSFANWEVCSSEEYEFIDNYIKNVEYDDYDRLIQLCDSLSLPIGYCLLEKRMIDVALRHGVKDGVVDKWKKVFENKEYFEKKMGMSLYDVLPGVVENTFEK